MSLAVSRSDTFALSVLQKSFHACATDHAVFGADWTRIWVSARRWACSTARQENFILTAFRDWWKHLECLGLDLSGAFASLNAFAIVRSEMSLFACATWLADTWAQWIWVLAGTIASFA